ncbi:MAG: asparaginase [Firmicutes bacterium]|nr:asparaginase [Bacillota bacterium]
MKKVYVIGTGGTISSAGREGSTTNYTNGVFDVAALIGGVPGIKDLADIRSEQIINVSSEDMTVKDMLAVARRIDELASDDSVSGFVVTHGTNTMEETAFFLDLAVSTEKPIVITGSMRPATAAGADGAMNLYESVALAAHPSAAGRGVMAVMGDRIFDASFLHKSNAFRVDAFTGGDAGCIGYMQDDVPFFRQRSELPHTTGSGFSADGLTGLPKVEIVMFYADADPRILTAAAEGADGLVLAGAGGGFAGRAWEPVLKETAGKIPVIRASRTMDGVVTRDDYDTRVGTVPGYALDPLKARILLSFALTKTRDHGAIEDIFKKYSGL